MFYLFRRISVAIFFLFPILSWGDEYSCTAEEYFRQNSVNEAAPALLQCGIYWPETRVDDYVIIKIGLADLSISGVKELRDEEVKPYRRINNKRDFIIISEDQIWSEKSDWCGRVNNLYTLNLGPGGVPNSLLSGYVLLNSTSMVKAVTYGEYKRMALNEIRGGLDDFIRVSHKVIIYDGRRAVVMKLAEKYREYMSRGVFFSDVSQEQYVLQKRLLKITAKTYGETPAKYKCRR